MTERDNAHTIRCMVDIETLGLQRDSAIISIGAVVFDFSGIIRQFYQNVSLESCQDAGLSIDADTLEWWLTQDDVAKNQLVGGDELDSVLSDFVEWYSADEIWANSPSFDIEMLELACDRCGIDVPWEFYEERDYRTLKALGVADDVEHEGTEHDALDDAKHQARLAATALERLETVDWGEK